MSREKQRANRREKDRRILTLAKKERLTKEEWLKREAEKRAQIEAEKAAKAEEERLWWEENMVDLKNTYGAKDPTCYKAAKSYLKKKRAAMKSVGSTEAVSARD